MPAELANAKRAKVGRVTLGTTVLAEVAAKVREVAEQRDVTVSAIIASALTAYPADVRSSPLVDRFSDAISRSDK